MDLTPIHKTESQITRNLRDLATMAMPDDNEHVYPDHIRARRKRRRELIEWALDALTNVGINCRKLDGKSEELENTIVKMDEEITAAWELAEQLRKENDELNAKLALPDGFENLVQRCKDAEEHNKRLWDENNKLLAQLRNVTGGRPWWNSGPNAPEESKAVPCSAFGSIPNTIGGM